MGGWQTQRGAWLGLWPASVPAWAWVASGGAHRMRSVQEGAQCYVLGNSESKVAPQHRFLIFRNCIATWCEGTGLGGCFFARHASKPVQCHLV